MESPSLTTSGPRELLLGSAEAYDASADMEMVRRVGALAWALTATLAAVMVVIWPPTDGLGSVGWVLAAVCLGVPGLAAVITARSRRVSLPVSLGVSLFSILAIGILSGLAGSSAHFTVLIAIPLIFVAASQTPRRVAAAVALAGASELVALLNHGLNAGTVTVAVVNMIIWSVLVALGLVWTSGVRWQRLALRDEQRHAEHLASHDVVTGLGNRRKLMADLKDVVSRGEEAVLALFDLNGFKAYNDTFGHPAGDSLLGRLGARLAGQTAPLATAYRMGGDEFCVLAVGPGGREADLVARGCRALTEHGPAFRVTASGGAAVIPDEARDPVSALRLADGRMYTTKQERRGRVTQDGAEMLLAVLQERDPALAVHAENVARLAGQVAERMQMDDIERRHLIRAAELHDIGKLAVPDAILDSTGTLSEEEYAFIRRHTLIGQRIVGSSPQMTRAGEIIRSSHERVDGTGYPDGLAGEQIPLAARIVYVCDSYDVLRSGRPYRPGISQAEAVAELRRCAGTQLDSGVVEALAEILDSEPSAPRVGYAASA